MIRPCEARPAFHLSIHKDGRIRPPEELPGQVSHWEPVSMASRVTSSADFVHVLWRTYVEPDK